MAGVKYVGLSPRTRALRWLLFVAAVGMTVVATGPTALDISRGWLTANQESLPWYASRLLGFLAYLFLTASVVYGLLLSTGILDALTQRTVSFTLHQELSAIGIALTVLHGAVLLLDTFIQTTLLQLLVPFAASYRPEWVGAGQIALLLMVAVYASFHMRRQIGQRAWRLLHYTTFLAFVGATAHGVMAGTDTSTPWAFWIYAGASIAVSFLLSYRIAKSTLLRGVST
jgi:hypothetical protein